MLVCKFFAFTALIITLSLNNTCAITKIKSAVIYDDFYVDSMPIFREGYRKIASLEIEMMEYYQTNLTHVVETISAAKVSSLFVLAKFVNCTAMVELKEAISVFFIGMMKDHCDPSDNLLLYMYPSHYDVMQAMYDAIEEYKWKTAAVFYDGSEELAFGYQDLDLARLRGINLKVWVIPEDEDETWTMLKSVRLLGYRTYILACEYEVATSILEKAVYLSMISEVNHWILPNLETHPKMLTAFLESSVRLTLLSATTIRDVLENSYTGNLNETVARNLVMKAITQDALNLMATACEETIALDCFAIPLSNDFQCGIDQGARSKANGSYYSKGTCTEVYLSRVFEIGATKIEYLEHHLGNPKGELSFVGYWHDFQPKYIAFVQAAVVFPEAPLQIGIVYEPPWMKWHINELTQEISFEGYLIDLLDTLANQLNFKYELIYNEKVDHDRENDSIADAQVHEWLKNKEVEFVLQKRPIHGEKLGDEELTIGFQQVSYFMVTLASGNTPPTNIWQFLAPFTYDSWAVLWSAMVVISAVLALVNHYNPFEWRKQALDETNDDVPVENFNKLGLGNSIWMAYAGIVHQGVDVEPRSYSGKMITGTWWYFTMLVIAAYTANLTAFLTQELSGEISSLDGLIAANHFQYGTTEDSDILHYFLDNATNPPYSIISETLFNNPDLIFNSTETILERISEGGFYFLAPYGTVAKVEQESCTYASVGEGFWMYQYGLPFQLGSRYTYVFNDAIGSLRDDGTLQELEAKWFNFRTECKEASFDIESNRLGVDNLGGMFILLLIGAILALIVHFGEVAWAARTRFKVFRNREEKKETSDNPVTDMKKRRLQERKELDQKIEDWEGGYNFWLNRMDHINKTLEFIDDQNLSKIKEIKTGKAEDQENNFSWWTMAYEKISGDKNKISLGKNEKLQRQDTVSTTTTTSGIGTTQEVSSEDNSVYENVESQPNSTAYKSNNDNVDANNTSKTATPQVEHRSVTQQGYRKLVTPDSSRNTVTTGNEMSLPGVAYRSPSPTESTITSASKIGSTITTASQAQRKRKIKKMLSFSSRQSTYSSVPDL